MLKNSSFFTLTDFHHNQLMNENDYVWEPLNYLKEYLADYPFSHIFTSDKLLNRPLPNTLIIHNDDIFEGDDFTIVFGNTNAGELQVYHKDALLHGASVVMAGVVLSGNAIEIGKGVLIEGGATIKSPTIIGDCTEIRQGAYIRGNVISGKSCVLGHTTEIKHAIFLNDAKAGHFNYIGDSILGNDTNLGAGTKFANLRFIDGNIFIEEGDKMVDTGRRKFGAILGDKAQTGCNSVTNPGTILGKGCFVMPNTTVRSGFHEPGSVIKK